MLYNLSEKKKLFHLFNFLFAPFFKGDFFYYKLKIYLIIWYNNYSGRLAQWIERLRPKESVEGSIPLTATIFLKSEIRNQKSENLSP